MSGQATTMNPEEMEATIKSMEQKMLQQEDLLPKMGVERETLEQDLEEMCDEMELNGRTRRRGKGMRKNGSKAAKDNINVHMVKIAADLLTEVFCLYKFTLRSKLLRFRDYEDRSFCARTRAAFERAEIRFYRFVWKKVREMAVTWLVKQRSTYVTHVRSACYGKYT